MTTLVIAKIPLQNDGTMSFQSQNVLIPKVHSAFYDAVRNNETKPDAMYTAKAEEALIVSGKKIKTLQLFQLYVAEFNSKAHDNRANQFQAALTSDLENLSPAYAGIVMQTTFTEEKSEQNMLDQVNLEELTIQYLKQKLELNT